MKILLSRRMAKLLDFRETGNGWYRFSIKAVDPDDFRRTIRRLKARIPSEERGWWEDEKEWEVAATPENEAVLVDIFENGASCVAMVKSQMRLL